MSSPLIDRRARQVAASLAAAARAEEGSAGPCSICKHRATRWVFANGYKPCCINPLVADSTFNVTTHEVEQDSVTCADARGQGEPCGPTGALFEPTLLASFLSWFCA